jgi:hypothetical protein
MIQKSIRLLTFFLIFTMITVRAGRADNQIIIPSGFAQSNFHDLSKEIGLAVSTIPLEPASPLGLFRFDVGVEASFVSIHNKEPYWTEVASNPPATLVVPKIHGNLGLPAGIDIGVIYASVPDSNISLIGGDIKFAILEGSPLTPAVALRGSYSKLNGVTDMNLNTEGVDLSISKGFGPFTPYLGIGETIIQSSVTNPALGLNSESASSFKGFVGAKISLFLLSLTGEADFGDIPIYSVRLNLGW